MAQQLTTTNVNTVEMILLDDEVWNSVVVGWWWLTNIHNMDFVCVETPRVRVGTVTMYWRVECHPKFWLSFGDQYYDNRMWLKLAFVLEF